MTKREFLRELESQLEVPDGTLDGDRRLADVAGWDSMAALLFIALADSRLGVLISGDQIAKSKTLNDLMMLLGDRVSE